MPIIWYISLPAIFRFDSAYTPLVLFYRLSALRARPALPERLLFNEAICRPLGFDIAHAFSTCIESPRRGQHEARAMSVSRDAFFRSMMDYYFASIFLDAASYHDAQLCRILGYFGAEGCAYR